MTWNDLLLNWRMMNEKMWIPVRIRIPTQTQTQMIVERLDWKKTIVKNKMSVTPEKWNLKPTMPFAINVMNAMNVWMHLSLEQELKRCLEEKRPHFENPSETVGERHDRDGIGDRMKK